MGWPFGSKRRVNALQGVGSALLNGASFGLADDLVGLVNADAGQQMRDFNDRAEEDLGGLYGAAELAGSLFMPVPLLGAGKLAARALKTAGKEAKIGGAVRLQHGSKRPWIWEGDAPDLDVGEGFGFHAGTKAQAKDRLEVPRLRSSAITAWPRETFGVDPTLRAPTFGHGYVNAVRLKPGREVKTDDLGTWSSGQWLHALSADKVKGISEAERQQLLRQVKKMSRHDGHADVREALRGIGVKRVKYINEAEGPGRNSYVALDPSVITLENPAFHVARAAAGGGAARVLFPDDANAPTPAESRGLLFGVRRRASGVRRTGGAAALSAP